MHRLRTTGIIGALACQVGPLLLQRLNLSSNNAFNRRLARRTRTINICVRHGVADLGGGRTLITRLFSLRKIFHKL